MYEKSVKMTLFGMIRSFPIRRSVAPGIVLASLLVGLAFLRFYLVRSTEQFVVNFERQNAAELAAGDTMSLSRRLGSLVGSVPLVCMTGAKGGVIFLEQKSGSCRSGIFVKRTVVDRVDAGGIHLEFYLALPHELKWAGFTLIFMQCVLLIALEIAARREERLQSAHKLERQRLEGAMNAVIAQTTQMLAHDVRRPFATLERGLQMIVDEKDPQAIKDIAGILVTEVGKSSAAVRIMLDDILLSGGLTSMERKKISLSDVLKESVLAVAPNQKVESKISWKSEFHHTHPIRGDDLKLTRAFSNILANAVDAIGDEGRIWILSADARVEQTSGVQVVIGNSGPAISSEVAEKIFEPFFTTEKKGGTGLGLAIVKKIVEAHDGTISCRSQKEGGVEFVVWLPAAPV